MVRVRSKVGVFAAVALAVTGAGTRIVSADSVAFSNWVFIQGAKGAPGSITLTATYTAASKFIGTSSVDGVILDLNFSAPDGTKILSFNGNFLGNPSITGLSAYEFDGTTVGNKLNTNGNDSFVYNSNGEVIQASLSQYLFDFTSSNSNGSAAPSDYKIFIAGTTGSGFASILASNFNTTDLSNQYYAGVMVSGSAEFGAISSSGSAITTPLPAGAWSGLGMLTLFGLVATARKKIAQ